MLKLIQTLAWLIFVFGMVILFFPKFEGVKVQGAAATMSIPKLDVHEPLYLTVDPVKKQSYDPILREGIAHAAGSAKPGEGGIGYYFAHSSDLRGGLVQPAVFARLNELVVVDEIVIEAGNNSFRYVVVDKRRTAATDISFLKNPVEKEQIVLQTCWPIGTDLQWLLIFAERV